MIRTFLILASVLLVPQGVSAATFPFLLETTYATGPAAPSGDTGGTNGGTTGGGRRDAENLYLQRSSASSAMSLSSASAASSEVSTVSSVAVPAAMPTTQNPATREEGENDELSAFPEFSVKEFPDSVAEEKLLYDGFAVSGVTSMDEKLTPGQRAAILAAEIKTVAQLKLYIRALAEDDENIRKIEIVRDTIVVSYRSEAKILGLFPVGYLLETTVDGDGVTVPQPWWHFAASDGVKLYAKDLEAAFEKNVDENDLGDIDEILTYHRQTLQTISNVLKAKHEAAMNSIRNMKG